MTQTADPAGHAGKNIVSGSNLEKVLKAGNFAFTCECGPPKGADIDALIRKATPLLGCADAVNVTDNQTAVARMSSIAASKILLDMGIEPVMQMVCRDRNRIAAQSDVFGAHVLGIRNMLCLTGDHQKFGNNPQAKNVYDLDSIQLINTVRRLRDEGTTLGGDTIEGRPTMFIGGAENPFSEPLEFRPYRLAKKVTAGAEFIQTQCIYDMAVFKKFMATVCELGLDKKVYILAGVTPLKSAGMATFMKNRVSGVIIPDEFITRMKGVAKEQQAEEGIKIALEQIEEIRGIPGVAGIHLMAIEWEHRVREIAERAKLLPRLVVK